MEEKSIASSSSSSSSPQESRWMVAARDDRLWDHGAISGITLAIAVSETSEQDRKKEQRR